MPENELKHSALPTPHSALDLSIIIVSWNVWDLLRACLHSIELVSQAATDGAAPYRTFGLAGAAKTLEVIVVDNASSDATADLIPSQFPWVRLIRSATNLGFTAGNNQGYRISRGRFIFFLNPDTEVLNTLQAGDGLWQLFAAIAADETVGMVGPQLRYADNSWQNSRRRFPTPLTGFMESTWLGRWWPNNPWVRRMHMLDWPHTFRHDVDWLWGAAMLARREALEAVRIPGDHGPFDENFFMYSEELDLCRRIKTAGWRIVYVPEALVVHYEGRSSEQVAAARHIYFNTSKLRYYRKYFGARWAAVLRAYLLLEFRLQLYQERLKRFLGHKRVLRTARIAAYQQVIDNGLNVLSKSSQSID